jgi:polygalacturonase
MRTFPGYVPAVGEKDPDKISRSVRNLYENIPVVLMSNFVTVKDYGALGDGATDDTAAFNAALAANQTVYVPAGDYRVSSSILLDRSDANFLIGAGEDATTITCTSTTESGIAVGSPPPAVWGVRNLTITRNATPTSTAHGIYAYAENGRAIIEDVLVNDQYHGIVLGTANFGRVQRVITHNNLGHGLYLVNTATSAVLQWEIIDLLTLSNDGTGLRVETVAGMASCTLGNWERIHTFGNSGYGVGVIGRADCPLFNIRWVGGFIGADGLHTIYLDTHAPDHGAHVLTNIHVELGGTVATGSAGTTPATDSGNGIHITANNGYVSIGDFWINGSSDIGVLSYADQTVLNNGIVQNCGQALNANVRVGIWIVQGGGQITNVSSFNSSGNTSQQVGLQLDTNSDGVLVDNVDLSFADGNTVTNLSYLSTGTENEIGFVKGNNLRGAAAITPGASPYTYTAGPMAETVYLAASTSITALTQGGVSVLPAATAANVNFTLELGPNEAAVITYTGTLTAKKMLH